MARFRMDDFRSLEHAPTSPANLRSKIAEVILSSTHAKARSGTAGRELTAAGPP